MSSDLKDTKSCVATRAFPWKELYPLSLRGSLVQRRWRRSRRMNGRRGQDRSSQFAILCKSCCIRELCPRISSLSLLATAIHDLDSFLMLENAPPKKTAKKDPYDRTAFWSYCENKKIAFQKFYMFCFALAKPE